MPVIMGTAGHIDHGKTSLIKALTGIDCDRLAEEQKRGITIELGFAYLDVDPQTRVGIVDVPGHERFVKNMVAGAAGIDFVLLVVAADEGVMPQTREHVEICTLLGIRTGIVALTKVDAVEPEWLELVQDEVRGYLADTFLADAPMIAVSAHSGQGLEALRAAISQVAARFGPYRRSDLFRLPVDRVFTMKGHGTVVTGTSISGALRVGEEVRIYPGAQVAKVRAIQVHGQTAEAAWAGERTAINLQGVEVADIARGDVLAAPDSLFPATVWDVELSCLPSAPRGIRHRTEVHLHHGAREVLARVHLVDRDRLLPGERAMAQIHLPEPLPAVFGDRCIVRSFSPLRTIAGGRIINPLGRRLRRKPEAVAALEALAQAEGEELIVAQLNLAAEAGRSFAELRVLTDVETKALDRALQLLASRQQAFLFDRDDRRWIGAAAQARLETECLAAVAAIHAKEPLRATISRAELTSSWGRGLSPRLAHFVIERLVRSGALAAEGDGVRLPSHQVELGESQSELKERLVRLFAETALMPPSLKALGEHDIDPKAAAPMVRMLVEEGTLIKVSEDLVFYAPAVAALVERVQAYLTEHADMGPAEFRELSGGITRKYSIPLLEYLDKVKITLRVGDRRQLRRR
ncbi:MAG: selenocysteine-specific translation elongation factor [Desulfomicrobiaceae bacterium]|jgi:selenocysteine-specific elongation factor|nr:selenocysteine-specific translation elongation factor [Desulfomicrobiaceae bacterium]